MEIGHLGFGRRRGKDGGAVRARQTAGQCAIGCVAAIALLAGCAPMQTVPVDLGPGPVELYVDGERVAEPLPAELDLKSDRGHVVFVKKAGHRAQQVILHSVDQPDGPPRLEPGAVAVQLRMETPKGRRLEVELDEGESGAPVDTPAAAGP